MHVPLSAGYRVANLILALLAMLLVILVASKLFTDALEHMGARLGISEGVTGSLFAAVGTALPETTVPLLALFAGTADTAVNEQISVGAILGAPLMLSTLSTFLMACSVLPRRGLRGRVRPERSGVVRDLHFFLAAFALAAIALLVPIEARALRVGLGLALLLLYLVYVLLTLRASAELVADGHATKTAGTMWLAQLGLPSSLFTILLQLGAGAALLLYGAKGFIAGVAGVAHAVGISALLLSLLIVPIATELPEKWNSILWIRKDKDTLAFGNISGAMVFQGTILPAIGILLTPWQARPEVVIGILVTLLAAAWLRVLARPDGLPLWALLINGALYFGYLMLTVFG